MKFGLKLWSINENWFSEAVDICKKGKADFIELFAYPKSFDNGNGFGCSIAFLNIQREEFLTKLHQACRLTMGPDERGSNFVPHLSLVYAPEDTQSVLEEYASGKQCQQHFINQPFEAKYLSL